MTQHIKTSVVAPKMNEVVCAYNFLMQEGAKPILQSTIPCLQLMFPKQLA